MWSSSCKAKPLIYSVLRKGTNRNTITLLSYRAKLPSVDPEPSAIAAVQRAADFVPVEGGFVRLLRDALQAQPGLYRAALCGAPS